jgi:hypothetical protein
VGTPSAAKIGAARGRSQTCRRQAHLPPLPPRRRAAVVFVFLPADEARHLSSPTPALRPVATKVRTSFLPALCGHPDLRAEGERVARTAPPPLVMPAIEPGWDEFLAGAAAFTNARAVCLA